jgi:site-specific DNA-adenine methylase
MGVHRQIPNLGNAGRGETTSTVALRAYLGGLAERLRRVRVCCGDWSRVCTETPTTVLGLTAVFLDPPYAVADRTRVYGEHDDTDIAHSVREWCLAVGDNRLMRIALCGYEGEHDELEQHGWLTFAWRASGGYASRNSRGNDNRHRERIWFSPHCLRPVTHRTLFDRE